MKAGRKTPKKPASEKKPASPRTKASAESAETREIATKPADAVDEQLARYRSMRDFSVTSEPSGGSGTRKPRPTGALPFVIQKHAASHLHYDFRLGWNGVLKSWAVAKGPSYFPGDKRLAVQVEDHPMEYGGFEGIIPQGQYGGGTVMVWDQGTWTPQLGYENVDAGLRDGSLKFVMNGKKMRGKWTLVRMGGKAASERKPNWLLIKEHDEFERGKDDAAITEEQPNSAVTGRTMEEIASHEDHVWNSKDTAGSGRPWIRKESNNDPALTHPSAMVKGHKTAANSRVEKLLVSLPKEAQPAFIQPQLAQETATPPDATGWLHELKLDGYRIQARKQGSLVQLLTRKGLDWTHRIPVVAKAVASIPAESITLDGEVVVLAENGTTNFADLQAAFQEGVRKPLTYFCFDLLHWNGRDTRSLPLRQRKELLEQILPPEDAVVRLSEHVETGGMAVFEKACELHAEGILSKRALSPYMSGRGADWLKSKCLREQEFVVAGYTLSSDGDDRIGSLVLGYYDAGKLIYAGRTGTGFTQKMRRMLKERLEANRSSPAPFDRLPADARRGVIWVQPKLVAQVRFATWTADNLVRQAAFLGLREDKTPEEVVREEPNIAPRPKAQRAANPSNASHRMKLPVAAKAVTAERVTRQSSPIPIRLTHPAKVLDEETSLTKQQLAEYYWEIAGRMLPHIAGRPLSLVRCPEGSGRPCFYQKHVNHMLPKGVESVEVPDKKTGKPEAYITLDTQEALAGLAQMGVLEVHPWGSKNDDLEHPDRLIFDLDPDASISWKTLGDSALEVSAGLRKLGLKSFLKTTGGKGLHVVAPIAPEHHWADVKEFAHRFVLALERRNPALYLTRMTKAARKDKIYLDYLRNERGATAVAPYSPRARAGVPVSVPLAWTALKADKRPVFRVSEFTEWRSHLKSEPWRQMLNTGQSLRLLSEGAPL